MKAAPVSCGAQRGAQARGSGTEEADRGPGSGTQQKSGRVVLESVINTRQSQSKRGSLTVLTVTEPSGHDCNYSLDCSCWEPSGGILGGRAGTDDASAAVEQLPVRRRACRATTGHRKSNRGSWAGVRVCPRNGLPSPASPVSCACCIHLSTLLRGTEIIPDSEWWGPGSLPTAMTLLRRFAASCAQSWNPGQQGLGHSGPGEGLVGMLSVCRKCLGPPECSENHRQLW